MRGQRTTLSSQRPQHKSKIFSPSKHQPTQATQQLRKMQGGAQVPSVHLSPPQQTNQTFHQARRHTKKYSTTKFLLSKNTQASQTKQKHLTSTQHKDHKMRPPRETLRPNNARNHASNTSHHKAQGCKAMRQTQRAPLPTRQIKHNTRQLRPHTTTKQRPHQDTTMYTSNTKGAKVRVRERVRPLAVAHLGVTLVTNNSSPRQRVTLRDTTRVRSTLSRRGCSVAIVSLRRHS